MKPYERQVQDLHALGLTDSQIYAEMRGEIARKTVGKVRRRLGLGPHLGKRRSPNKSIDREYLAREFDESMKALQLHGDHSGVRRQIRRVASDLDVSYDNLINIYSHEMGLVERQSVRKYSDEQYAEAKRLLDEHGLSYTEVERQTGIPRDRLGKVIPGRGLTPSEAQTVRWVNVHMRKMGI